MLSTTSPPSAQSQPTGVTSGTHVVTGHPPFCALDASQDSRSGVSVTGPRPRVTSPHRWAVVWHAHGDESSWGEQGKVIRVGFRSTGCG
jgi:hypothetical protein